MAGNVFVDVYYSLKRFELDHHSVFFKGNFHFLQFFQITPGAQTIIILVAILLFIISFLVSGSLVAFFSLSSKEINVLKTHKHPSFRRIVDLLEKPAELLATLRIVHNLLNIGLVLIFNTLFDAWFPQLLPSLPFALEFLIKLGIVAVVIILFLEMLPKIWATHHKVWFASTSSLLVEVFISLFGKLSLKMMSFSENLEKGLGGNDDAEEQYRLDQDIDLLSDQEATNDEKRILKGIRKFGDTNVKQVMRTRLDVSGLDLGMHFHDMIRKAHELQYSRLPVFHKNLDDIKGVLHTKDLLPFLHETEQFDWHFLIRKPYFVHEQKLIDDLLQEFRNKRIHFAIVVDEFGGTSGIVTLEDILEEIIGDIKDEFDDEESGNKKIDDFNYIFEGKTMIHDACAAMDLPLDTFDMVSGDSDSMAGLLLEIAGEFPQVNTVLKSGDFTFIPLEMSKNRIDKIKVIIQPSQLRS